MILEPVDLFLSGRFNYPPHSFRTALYTRNPFAKDNRHGSVTLCASVESANDIIPRQRTAQFEHERFGIEFRPSQNEESLENNSHREERTKKDRPHDDPTLQKKLK
jgi:hypothetical protein